MNNIQLNAIRMDKASTLASAISIARHWIKMPMIIMGCDDKVWLVRPVDGEKLIKAGYEAVSAWELI